MSNAIQTMLSVAQSCIGYKEGANNWNKFADRLDSIGGLFSFPMQNQPWCGIFTLYCMEEAFGADTALKVMCSPKPSGIPLCSAGAGYYKSAGRWYSSPQAGDIIFFYVSGGINHTGIVESVNGSIVTTIEGNTSDMVARRTYSIGDSMIAGYGRPKYELVGTITEATPVPATPTVTTQTVNKYNLRYHSNNNYVKELQEKLIKLGYDCGPDGADGDFGKNTLDAVQQYQREHGLEVDGIVGTQTWAQIEKDIAALNKPEQTTTTVTTTATDKYNIRYGMTGDYVKELQEKLIKLGFSCGKAGADGEYGKDTLTALTDFQQKNGLEVDGIAGPLTWAAISKALNNQTVSSSAVTSSGSNVAENEIVIWNYLKGKGLNDYAVAGIMGNLYAESVLLPNNLQNTYENSLGMTDAQYTAAVDNGTYQNFVYDQAGYGLAQWTYWSRKNGLLKLVKSSGKSIADIGTQLDYLWSELQSYTKVMNTLRNASSVVEASNMILVGFEQPADQSDSAKTRRAGFGQTYYTKYAGGQTQNTTTATCSILYNIRVTADILNIRSGAGTNYPVVGQIRDKGIYAVVSEGTGAGAKAWLKLKSGAGWIAGDYTERV